MTEQSAGGIVVRGDEVLMIRDRYGRWTFPKGHIEQGETPKEAAVREVLEETGVQAVPGERLGQVGYALSGGNDKQVTWFFMTYENGEVRPLQSEIAEARWLGFDQAQEQVQRHGYPGYRALLRKAREIHSR
jgi:8-oxo-dGTP pyrophosphatase MutT (NUDIX family)